MFRLSLSQASFHFQNPVFILHGSSSSDLQTYLDTGELGFAKDHIVIQAIIRETLYAGNRGIAKGTLVLYGTISTSKVLIGLEYKSWGFP